MEMIYVMMVIAMVVMMMVVVPVLVAREVRVRRASRSRSSYYLI